MPSVPMPPGRQIRSQGLGTPQLGVNLSAEDFGGGQSNQQLQRATSEVANTGMQLAYQAKREADTSAFTKADSATQNLRNDLFWNKDSGAWKQKGENALNVTEQYLEQYDKQTADIENSLSNSEQKLAYSKTKASNRLELMSQLERHSAQEATAYQNQITDSGIKSATDDAILNYHDPGKISDALTKQQDLIKEWATRQGYGLDSDIVKEKMETQASQTHTGVINRMLANGEDQLASHYYKEVKSDVRGEDAIRLEKNLEEGSTRGESQRLSDQILAKNPNPADQLEAIKEIKDPKLRDATRDRVVQAQSDQERATDYAKKKTFNDGINILQRSGGHMDVPPDQFEFMDAPQKNAYNEYKKKLLSGTEIATDLKTYYKLQQMSPSQFKSLDLTMYINKLSTEDFKKMVDAQKNEKAFTGIQADTAVINSVLGKAGMETKADDVDANNLRSAIEKQANAYFERTGKKPTNVELEQLATKLTTQKVLESGGIFEGFMGGNFFEKSKRVYEVEYKDIPKTEKQAIIRALQKRRVPVTEDRILNLYTQGLSNAD